MSHEIRTPLNAITGMSHLRRGERTPEQDERLARIENASEHLLPKSSTRCSICRRSKPAS